MGQEIAEFIPQYNGCISLPIRHRKVSIDNNHVMGRDIPESISDNLPDDWNES